MAEATRAPATTSPAAARPPSIVGDGQELLAWLGERRRTAPVWRDPSTGATHVFGHAEAVRVLSQPATFSSDFRSMMPPPDPDAPNFMEGSLTVTDPPRHGQLRRLVSQAFTPRMVAQLERRVGEIAQELLDGAGDREELDLVADLAYPLPVIVIAELLGIPSGDRLLFRRWAELLISNSRDVPVGSLGETPFSGSTAEQLRDMSDYLLAYVRERRRAPDDDLISRLVAAEVDGERLGDKEAVNFSAFLLLAGHLTTTLLLGNTMLCLDESPQTLARLRLDPTGLAPAIEEVLRYRPPVVFLYRLAREPARVGGLEVPAGGIVVSWVLSANRDERAFRDGDRFDPSRSPNPHLTFSHGIHFCLGAPLARLETRIVLRALLDRYRELRRSPAKQPTYHQNPDIFGVTSLPIQVRRA